MHRRTVLKAGVAAGVLLAAGGTAAWLAGRDPVEDRRTVLAAVIPVLLGDALPAADARAAALRQALAATEAAIAGLAPAARDELARLFALLALAPTRLALAGVSQPWHAAPPEAVAGFLQRWRGHRLALLQAGYHALHDLVTGPWYADAANWPAIGYPGPPQL